MIPMLVMAAMKMAQNKAQNEQNDINYLNNNQVQYGQDPNEHKKQQINMLPQQSNGMGNLFSSVYSGLLNSK